MEGHDVLHLTLAVAAHPVARDKRHMNETKYLCTGPCMLISKLELCRGLGHSLVCVFCVCMYVCVYVWAPMHVRACVHASYIAQGIFCKHEVSSLNNEAKNCLIAPESAETADGRGHDVVHSANKQIVHSRQ